MAACSGETVVVITSGGKSGVVFDGVQAVKPVAAAVMQNKADKLIFMGFLSVDKIRRVVIIDEEYTYFIDYFSYIDLLYGHS